MESNYLDRPEERRLYTPENVLMLACMAGIIIVLLSVILPYIFLSQTEIRWLYPDYSRYIVPSIIAIIWAYIYWRMRK